MCSSPSAAAAAAAAVRLEAVTLPPCSGNPVASICETLEHLSLIPVI